MASIPLFAISIGNFSSATIWSTTKTGLGGSGPPVAGNTAVANTFAVVMDQASLTCDELTNSGSTGGFGGNDGGSFTLNLTTSARTVNANVLAGNAACLVLAGNTDALVVNGNVTGGFSGTCQGVSDAGGAAITVNGNVNAGTSGAGGSAGIICGSSSGGNVTVNGSLVSQPGTSAIAYATTATTGTVTVNNGNISYATDGTPPIYGGVSGDVKLIYNPGATNTVTFQQTSGQVVMQAQSSFTNPVAHVANGTTFLYQGATQTGSAPFNSTGDKVSQAFSVTAAPSTQNTWSSLSSPVGLTSSNQLVNVDVSVPSDSDAPTNVLWEVWGRASSAGPDVFIAGGGRSQQYGGGAYPIISVNGSAATMNAIVNLGAPFYSIAFRAKHDNVDGSARTITFAGAV